MQFNHVAECFERIEQISSRLEITELLAELLRQATPEEASIICNLSLGQLNPPYQGTQFNLAQKNIIKAVALLMHTSPNAIEAQVKNIGDVGLVIATNLLSIHTSENTNSAISLSHHLTIEYIYNALKTIEHLNGVGSQEEKINQLVDLMKQISPQSAKYVVRIILGTLRLGFSDMTLIDALSWMSVGDKSIRTRIEHAYNLCADLGLIAALLKKEGIHALDSMIIHTGIPIRPASAERLPSAQAIIEKIGPACAQPKLDGFRVQVHVDNSQSTPNIHFFSRNLQDFSYMFPDLIPALSHLSVNTLIAEGEVICFDQNTGSFLPFQETAKRRRKHDIDQAIIDFPLKLFLFDLLYLNNQSQLAKTHQQRRSELLSLFANYSHNSMHDTIQDNAIQVIDEVEVHTGVELENYFLSNVSLGLEGIVVKRPDAPYQPGKRNFNWIKLKRQETGHLQDTIDCVILGYYSGYGKRAQFGIGAFLVGVFNPELDSFQTIAKIGTGLKDAGWKELKHRCDARAVTDKPHNVLCPKELTPDVWVWPEMVCLVRADDITLSPVHTAGKTEQNLGYALRFPRIMGYREDKAAQDATTVEEVARLYQIQFAS